MESSSSRKTCWPESVEACMKKLGRFDRICVIWIDASESSNVPLGDLKVPNHAIETTIRSEGKFFGIQDGPSFSDPHILIMKEMTDQKRGTLESIPLALVKDIQIFDKIPRKTAKTSEHRHVFRYKDGIVKRLRQSL
ncbi:MAG: hypothetical protein ACYC7D_05490 [Nitrososphaerales archaeon]